MRPNKVNRTDPSMFDTFLLDPTVPVDPVMNERTTRDQQRFSRKYIYAVLRWLIIVLAVLFLPIKRLLPWMGSNYLFGKVTVWMVKHCMSFEAQSYFLAHFHYEADILNFITKNSGLGMTEVDLKPHSVDDLGEWQARNTVIEHDRNVYSFIQEMGIALNDLGQSSIDITRPSFENLDFSMLNAPDVSVDDEKDQFFLRLDIDSSCAVICFLIATFMTQKDLERAISSLQFDQSLMFLLQQITGDIRFLSWTNLQFTNWVAHYVDSTTALRKHLFCIEYAHGALMQLKKKQSEQVIRASQ